jgi:hypothetical protein
VCPQCGSSADVRTARELFDLLSGQQGFPQAGPPLGAGPGPSASEGYAANGGSAAASQGGPAASQGGGPAASEGGGPAASQGGGPAANQGTGPAADEGGGPAAADFGPNNLSYGPNAHAYQSDADSTSSGRGSVGDGGYDNYNVEGSDRKLRFQNRLRRGDIRLDNLGENIADEIGGAVVDAALGFAGRAIGRRMMKAFEERVLPAVQARAGQAMQQSGQQSELNAIAARYPELRGCLRDQVIFVDGGVRTVAVSELTLPVTLAQADAVVTRLR